MRQVIASKPNRKGEFVLRAFSAVPIETAPPQSQEVTVIEYHSTPLPQETTTTTVQVTEQTTTTQQSTQCTSQIKAKRIFLWT